MRMRRRHSVDIHASAAQLHDKSPVAGMPLPFRQSSMIQSLASQLGNRAM